MNQKNEDNEGFLHGETVGLSHEKLKRDTERI